ncbi:MAG: helix-turn-helix transcriptional regulator [Candidatus Limnocylindrales bacterium]
MSANDDSHSLIARVYDAPGLGNTVRVLRTERGWTQADLAEWLGVHRVTVAKLERGGTVDLPVAMRAIALLDGVVEIRTRRGRKAPADA